MCCVPLAVERTCSGRVTDGGGSANRLADSRRSIGAQDFDWSLNVTSD